MAHVGSYAFFYGLGTAVALIGLVYATVSRMHDDSVFSPILNYVVYPVTEFGRAVRDFLADAGRWIARDLPRDWDRVEDPGLKRLLHSGRARRSVFAPRLWPERVALA